MHPLVRVLQFPLTLIPPQARFRVLLGPLRGAVWIVGSGNHVCWMGLYEYRKQLALKRMLSRGRTVYDIGAHVGFHSLLCSRIVGPAGRVCAFEPLPRNLRYLHEHLALNNAANVQVIEAAVADHATEEAFAENGSYMGRLRQGGTLSVKTVAVDAMVQAGDLPGPDYVKIDVEGAEMRVLRGMRETLATYRPTLLLATHSPDLHRECIQFLTELGYRLEPLTGRALSETDELVAHAPAIAVANLASR
jgi:FkbM family methyltransferase